MKTLRFFCSILACSAISALQTAGQVVAISAFSPTAGNVGTTVTISGNNFNTTPADNIVYFGAVRGTVSSATSSTLQVTVPAGASYAPITVTTGGLTAYSHLPFTVTFPSSQGIDSRAFTPSVVLPNGSKPYLVTVGDLDGDGKPDIISGSNDLPTFTLFRNTSTAGSITFADPVVLPAGFTSITVFVFLGDIDGDGLLDLVCPVRDAQLVSVFRNTSTVGNFSFAPRVDFGVGTNPRRAAIRDLDGDGKPDLVVANMTDDNISVLRNTSSIGSISFESKIDFPTEDASRNNIVAGDIDGDGKPDIAVFNYNGASFSILRNTSSSGSLSFAARVNFPIGDAPSIVTGLGDLDNDGSLDVAVVGYNTNQVFAFRNTSSAGNISFASGIQFSTGLLPNNIGLGDIDGDGWSDLAVTNSNSNTVSVFKNQSVAGTISFGGNVDFPTGGYPISLAVNDLDGDTQPDVIVTNNNDQTVSVLRNTLTPQAVTFQVNMNVKIAENTFRPDLGDIVTVPGGFNSWTPPELKDTLNDDNSDGIYSRTIYNLETGPIQYKFWKTTRGGIDWEGNGNREYTVVAGSQTLPVVFFDRDEVAATNVGSTYISGNGRIRVTDGSPVNPAANPSAYIITGNTITVEAWIFPLSAPSHNTRGIIVTRPYYTTQLVEPFQAYELCIDNTGVTNDPRFEFVISDGQVPGNWGRVRDIQPVPIGQWTHVAGTYDGSSVRLYINGTQVASAPYSENIGAGNTGLYIGRMINANFNGLIDDVRLWNIARTQPEIQANKDITLLGNEMGLAGYWPLDKDTTVNGNSPVTTDRTANHNDLWVQGAATFLNTVPPNEPSIPPGLGAGTLEAVVGEPFSFRPGTSGWPVPTLSLVSGPSGMTFDPGTQTVQWTPSIGQTGYNNFEMSATNPYGTASATFTVLVDAYPARFVMHNNNNVKLFVGNNGMLGRDSTLGGFEFNGLNGLYEADLLIAQSPNQVSGQIYFREFGVETSIQPITSYLRGFDQAYEARFNDLRAPNPMGLVITQRSHSKSTSPDRNFVIMDYIIRNTSGSPLSGIFVGLGLDLDIGDPYHNLGGHDAARGLAYMYEPPGGTNPNYYGVAAINRPVSGYGFHRPNQALNEADYYQYLTTSGTTPTQAGDYRIFLGSGPFDIPAGGSVQVMFAMVAGTSLADLQATADAARSVQFTPAIGITSFAPLTGAVGSSVTITGLNFDPTPANNIVYFGAVRATVTAATPTSLTVTVPAGATYAPITVTTNGLTAYSRLPFTVTFPSGRHFDMRSFAEKADIMQDNNPFMLAVGDLDVDGKADVVAASIDSALFTLLRNTSTTGSISFASALKLTAGENPVNAFLGDLDGDGKLDIASAAFGANAVSIFRNTSTTGNLSFAERMSFSVGANPRRVAIQDFDGDGKLDLATTNYGENTVSVLRNAGSIGSISFESKIDFATENQPHFILPGDVDADGRADLVVLGVGGNAASILRNLSTPGNISFASKVDIATGTTPYMAGLGDLDGDGLLDLAVANYNSGSVSVFRNTSSVGNISFAPGVELAVGNNPRRPAMGDIDGDGKPDLAITVEGANTVSVFKNESTAGTLQFGPRMDLPAGSNPLDVSISDLDGDSKPDLVVSNRTARSVSVFRNTMTPQTVTFRVNMKVKMLEFAFSPASGDVVTVTGSFNNWDTTRDTLTDADGDSIYTGSVYNLPTGSISYKFWKTLRGGISLEADPNRTYTVVAGAQTLPVVYFDRDSIVAPNPGAAYLKNRSLVRVLDNNPVRPDAVPAAYSITGNAITLEAWIFPITLPPFPGTDIILSRPSLSTTPGGYDLAIRDTSHTGQPRITFRISLGDTHLILRDIANVQTGVWKHVAATYNGSTARLYVNGNQVATATRSGSIAAGTQGLFIGGTNTANAFHGLIDEVRVWNSVRTQTQIRTSSGGILIGNEAGLAGYWPLDGATTVNGKYPVTIDKTSNHNDLWALQDAEFVGQPQGSIVTLDPEVLPDAPAEALVGSPLVYKQGRGGWPLPTLSLVYGPIGMTFDPATNQVSWTPAPWQSGRNEVKLRATNTVGTAENTYTIWVNALPTVWHTHNNSAVTLHFANNGLLGMSNADAGFNFNGTNGLYEATVLVGRSPNQVSGTLYTREFAVQDTFKSIVSYLSGFDQAYETRFNDQRVANPIGVQVIQRSHSKSTDPHRQCVIIDYEILNTSGAQLEDIYVGLVADFDVFDAPMNLSSFDASRNLLYTYHAGNPNQFGMISLSGPVSGYAVWRNGVEPDQADSALYYRLTHQMEMPSGPWADYRQIIGTGPHTIPVASSVHVMFALVAGSNLPELQSVADAVLSLQLMPQPTIVSVKDVPGDQGGKVTLRWNASSLDNQIHNLPYYSIWRAVPEHLATRPSSPARESTAATDDEKLSKQRITMLDGAEYAWEWLYDMPAHRFSTYTYTAATLYDSMATTDGRHYFLVSAQTNDPLVFYDSNVDSGYSVDNLAPIPPTNPVLATLPSGSILVKWEKNRVDPDVTHYRVYHSTTSGFAPSDTTLMCTTRDTTAVDRNAEVGIRYYYCVAAVDTHGNVGEPTQQMSGVPLPLQLLSFTANVLSHGFVAVEWTTPGETDNLGFEVQKSLDSASLFQSLPRCFIAGYGTTSEPQHYTYVDSTSSVGIWWYRLKQIDVDGTLHYSDAISIEVQTPVEVPTEYALQQNYPNPFNPGTIIKYQIPNAGHVTLKVFDLLGREVLVLVNGIEEAGYKSVTFNAGQYASGIYFYELKAGTYRSLKKMVVLK